MLCGWPREVNGRGLPNNKDIVGVKSIWSIFSLVVVVVVVVADDDGDDEDEGGWWWRLMAEVE